MKRIGMRNLKTTIAILICLLVDVLFMLINPTFEEYWFSPFFAGIAAAYSLQSNQQNSVRQARIRSIGSIVGGVLGVAILYFYAFVLQPVFLSAWGIYVDTTIYYLTVAIIIIPLIYYLSEHQQSQLIFVAILTYLSVTVGTRNNLPAYVFGINRIASTIFGVMVALGVNTIHFNFYKNTDILFVSGLDGALLSEDRRLSSYTRYKLDQMLRDGMNLTISTTRTPASLVPLLEGLEFPVPLMIMNGAVVFHMKTHHYSQIKRFETSVQQRIEAILEARHRNAFVYSITDDVLTIHHGVYANEAEQKFYESRRNDSFRNHVKGDVQEGYEVVFYILIDRESYVRDVETEIMKSDIANDVLINIYPFDEMEGYFYLKINSANASKSMALDEFVQVHQPKMVVTVGSKPFDLPMMAKSNVSFVSVFADKTVQAKADYVLSERSRDAVVRELARVFYHRHPEKYLRDRSSAKNSKSA